MGPRLYGRQANWFEERSDENQLALNSFQGPVPKHGLRYEDKHRLLNSLSLNSIVDR